MVTNDEEDRESETKEDCAFIDNDIKEQGASFYRVRS